jgi:hypothetical protein
MASKTLPHTELLGILLEQHRHYINRNWQYFAAILLIDSVVFNSYGDLKDSPRLVATVSLSATAFVGIFYHLINWTDMRIDRNALRVNKLAEAVLVESPQGAFEGLIPWMKIGVVVAAIPHLFLAGEFGGGWLALELGLFIGTLVLSEVTVRRARMRPIVEIGPVMATDANLIAGLDTLTPHAEPAAGSVGDPAALPSPASSDP